MRLGIIGLIAALFVAQPAYANDAEIQCLANAVFYEARSESAEGKKAVAHVVINRTESKKYPSSVCRVVSQKGQFSWYPRPNVKDRSSLDIARRVFLRLERDNTLGSLSFHSTLVNPRWKMKRTVRIGRHVFYK